MKRVIKSVAVTLSQLVDVVGICSALDLYRVLNQIENRFETGGAGAASINRGRFEESSQFHNRLAVADQQKQVFASPFT